jgi:transcriptional regulator with GAF, ATPase, and Fis domain
MSTTLVGSSPSMVGLWEEIKKAARCDKTVLLLGETGTGKDLVARKIHELGPRAGMPFVAVNCSALPETLFESELFGHDRGAFTGAVSEKQGLLEAAGKGTLFMDEIGELTLPLQAKILRLLDKKEARRVGGTAIKRVEARFIFATNRDLVRAVKDGSFRQDLYFRVNVLRIEVPALRERKEDIPALIEFFLERENARSGMSRRISDEALEKIMKHDFPGNVRELENVLERAYVSSEADLIRASEIRFDREEPRAKGNISSGQLVALLDRCRWNKSLAARQLGKSRRQLYRMLEKHGLRTGRLP